MMYSNSTMKANVRVLSIIILCVAILVASCSPAGKNVELNSDVFAEMESQRTKAEEYVIILKQTYPAGSPEYKRGREYYIQAEAEFNGTIEEFKAKLIAGQVSDFEPMLTEAVEKSETFVEYVKSPWLPGGSQHAVDPKVVALIVGVLIETGKAVWEQYRGAEKEKQDALLLQLDSMKWKSFEEIKP